MGEGGKRIAELREMKGERGGGEEIDKREIKWWQIQTRTHQPVLYADFCA